MNIRYYFSELLNLQSPVSMKGSIAAATLVRTEIANNVSLTMENDDQMMLPLEVDLKQ